MTHGMLTDDSYMCHWAQITIVSILLWKYFSILASNTDFNIFSGKFEVADDESANHLAGYNFEGLSYLIVQFNVSGRAVEKAGSREIVFYPLPPTPNR